jgi:2-polyprenyl-3-methyl-5-hydroxy-6-metoxy-1,4-benzoquinol methylase
LSEQGRSLLRENFAAAIIPIAAPREHGLLGIKLFCRALTSQGGLWQYYDGNLEKISMAEAVAREGKRFIPSLPSLERFVPRSKLHRGRKAGEAVPDQPQQGHEEEWSEYFQEAAKKEGALVRAHLHWQSRLPAYRAIADHLAKGSRILEVGCGEAWSAIWLTDYGYNVTGIDSSRPVLELAERNKQLTDSKVSLELADAHDLSAYYGAFDLCFSMGVVEHFTPPQIEKILREQARCARFVLTTVPTPFTEYLPEGTTVDWYYYSRKQWRRMFEKAGIKVLSQFGFEEVGSYHRHLAKILPRAVSDLIVSKLDFSMALGTLGYVPGAQYRGRG